VIARPAPKDPFQELLSGWTHRPDWKGYGPDFARALAERGWEDLAFEVTANLLTTPGLTPEGKAEGLLAAAGFRALAAAREPDREDRLILLEGAIRALRDLDASGPLASRVRDLRSGLHRALALDFLRAGQAREAGDELAAGLDLLDRRIEESAAAVIDPPDPGDAAGLAAWRKSRDPVLLARLDWAEALVGHAEAAAELPDGRSGLAPLLKRAESFLERHLASVPGAELAGVEASTILGRVLRIRALSADRESAPELWRRCFAALSAAGELMGTPAGRARPLTVARSAALARRSEDGGRHLEDLLREAPAGSWTEGAALDLAAELGVISDPRRAKVLADRLFERGGDDLVRAIRIYRAIGDAPSRYRIGLAYAALGRPLESAAAVDRDSGDSVLLRFRSLREAAALTGERRALDELVAGGAANPNSPRLAELDLEISRLASLRPVRPAAPELRVEGPLAGVVMPRAPTAFASRLQRTGADGEAEAAVRAALRWLSRHQAKDGSWESQSYIRECLKLPKFSRGGGTARPTPDTWTSTAAPRDWRFLPSSARGTGRSRRTASTGSPSVRSSRRGSGGSFRSRTPRVASGAGTP
jgi:hypothetical protein